MSFLRTIIESLHQRHIVQRRMQVLAQSLRPLYPQGVSVLDVGCGDGSVTATVIEQRRDLSATGLEVKVRDCRIPVKSFDGKSIPFGDNSHDIVQFIDVLHHTNDISALLKEARRVAKTAILIKDHLNEGLSSQRTLQFMDDIGNRRNGVPSPGNYLTRSEWKQQFEACELDIGHWQEQVGLYPFPLSLCFDRSLHFIAKLQV